MKPGYSRARRKALAWFIAHEADPTAALFSEPPSPRMVKQMKDASQLVDTGRGLALTAKGRADAVAGPEQVA